MANKYKIVDLFSGCGGFGLGAKLAGFEVIVSVDIDSTLQSSYQKNFPTARVLNGDLSKMDSDSWRIILSGHNVDGVIGGPPCQGFSRIGKNEINDPRRSLLGHFFRTVNIIQPKFFIMENVEGLLDKGNKNELLEAIDIVDERYTVLPPIVVDAYDYGAPTRRKRVVVIGYDANQIHQINIANIIPNNIASVNVRDAISDLPSPILQTKDDADYGWSSYKQVPTLSSYAQKMRTPPPNGLGWGIALENLKNLKISGNFDTVHTDDVKARYASIIPGEVDSVSRSKRLHWEGICPTLRAGTGSDKGGFQAVRPLHPDEARVITVREAARLQGFPDWFCFHVTKWHSFRMIGNSVSPLVSENILSMMKGNIREEPIINALNR